MVSKDKILAHKETFATEGRKNLLYDVRNPESIEAYGKQMIGKTFRQIYQEYTSKGILKEGQAAYMTRYEKKGRKGGIGNLVEECWFGYTANSNPEADFPLAGVELKVTPYTKTSKGLRAKERLVLGMIDYMEIVRERDLEHSHLWKKIQLILLVWYLHIKEQSAMDSTIDHVRLFTPPAEDMEIIREDFAKIIRKIKAGQAHELSEGDTLYLGACTKSSDASKRRAQPFSDIDAKPRAFSFKNSYMTYVLTHYILPGKSAYEPAVKPGQQVSNFERYIMDKISAYRGYSINQLATQFGIRTRPKDLSSILVFRILGVSGNHCEEFEKAGIVIKTIRLQEKGTIRENMSFPPIKYQALAQETWEDSTFGNYLRDTRFLFVVYREDGDGEYRLQGGQFWNIPAKDLDGDVRAVWQETHDIISGGTLTLRAGKGGTLINNLPKKIDHPISHVRPHATNRDDTSKLPSGTKLHCGEGVHWTNPMVYTKHCFWLNNDYILSQLCSELREPAR